MTPRAFERGRAVVASAAKRPAVRFGVPAGVAFAALIAGFALPKAQPRTPVVAAADAPIVAAETMLSDAVRAGNRNAARHLLALQFTLVDAAGKTHSRKEFLAALKAQAAPAVSEIRTRNFGRLGMASGRHMTAAGAEAFFLHVWVKQKGAWRALLMQEVPLDTEAAPAATAAAAAPVAADECDNPCRTLPYRVRSSAEQEVLAAFQTVTKAVVARDAQDWSKHVADEFVAYVNGRKPLAKVVRIAAIEEDKESGAAVRAAQVQNLHLAVYGDSAVMTTAEAEPPHATARAARVFVKRDGRWLLAVSAHTDVK